MILVVSRDQQPYIMITWSSAVYHRKYMAPCYQVEYANSDRIKQCRIHADDTVTPAKGHNMYSVKFIYIYELSPLV